MTSTQQADQALQYCQKRTPPALKPTQSFIDIQPQLQEIILCKLGTRVAKGQPFAYKALIVKYGSVSLCISCVL